MYASVVAQIPPDAMNNAPQLVIGPSLTQPHIECTVGDNSIDWTDHPIIFYAESSPIAHGYANIVTSIHIQRRDLCTYKRRPPRQRREPRPFPPSKHQAVSRRRLRHNPRTRRYSADDGGIRDRCGSASAHRRVHTQFWPTGRAFGTRRFAHTRTGPRC